MDKELQGLRGAIADLKLIKEAISKSDNILRFIDAAGALRGILLAGGLLIAAFAAAFYCLLERYGSFTSIPVNLRIIIFLLLGLSCCAIGYLKIRNFLHVARKTGIDMTFYNLLEEIYTPRLLELYLPYIAVIVLMIVFLNSKGYATYIIPLLAVLLGLLIISLRALLFLSLKEFYFLGLWLTGTGLTTLFIAEIIHPLALLVITFAAGFILASLFLYLSAPGEKERQR